MDRVEKNDFGFGKLSRTDYLNIEFVSRKQLFVNLIFSIRVDDDNMFKDAGCYCCDDMHYSDKNYKYTGAILDFEVVENVQSDVLDYPQYFFIKNLIPFNIDGDLDIVIPGPLRVNYPPYSLSPNHVVNFEDSCKRIKVYSKLNCPESVLKGFSPNQKYFVSLIVATDRHNHIKYNSVTKLVRSKK